MCVVRDSLLNSIYNYVCVYICISVSVDVCCCICDVVVVKIGRRWWLNVVTSRNSYSGSSNTSYRVNGISFSSFRENIRCTCTVYVCIYICDSNGPPMWINSVSDCFQTKLFNGICRNPRLHQTFETFSAFK